MKITITLTLVAVLLFGLTGTALAQEETNGGNLLFLHTADGFGPLDVVLFNGADQPIGFFGLSYGETMNLAPEGLLPEGQYRLGLHSPDDPDTILAALDFYLETPMVLVIQAWTGEDGSLMLGTGMDDGADPEPSPSETSQPTPRPSPTAIRTPNRVETGGGGTAPNGPIALLAAIALVASLTASCAGLQGRHS